MNKYFDSLSYIRLNSNQTLKGTGYGEMQRWINYWNLFSSATGDFKETLEIKAADKKQSEYDYFMYLNNLVNNDKSITGESVDFEEIGPKEHKKIKTLINNNWVNPHYGNNTGDNHFSGHVGLVSKLYQHPTNDDYIYAVVSDGGGGLFFSNDGGYNWEILNTDYLPNSEFVSFDIKPLGMRPYPEKEILFVAMSKGAIYRSDDNGQTWLEAGYNGTHDYPILFNYNIPSSPDPIEFLPNSLPPSGYFVNESPTISKVGKFLFSKKSNNVTSSNYERAIITYGKNIFYSDNYGAAIIPNFNQFKLTNLIEWKKFETTNIITYIKSLPLSPGAFSKEEYFGDFEFFVKNGVCTYVVQVIILEKDNSGNAIQAKQYLIKSTDFGTSWELIGENKNNTPQNISIGLHRNVFYFGNIEVKVEEPNYLYIANTNVINLNNSYLLHCFNLNDLTWNDLSKDTFDSRINTVPNGFSINQHEDDANWWFYTNEFHIFKDGQLYKEIPVYSGKYHADVRELLFLRNGHLLIGTDGGVYRSTDGGINFNSSTEGINAVQSDNMAVAQKPPFYVASGFWHGGFNVYNPDIDEWHQVPIGDGAAGEIFFLNNERFSAKNQFAYQVINDFNKLNNEKYFYVNPYVYDGKIRTAGPTKSSENIAGRAYGVKRIEDINPDNGNLTGVGTDVLVYTNDDFDDINNTNEIILNDEIITTPLSLNTTIPIVIPNVPDKLAILSENLFTIVSGMNNLNPNPTLFHKVNLSSFYTYNPDLASVNKVIFDPRRNGICWFIVLSYPDWSENAGGNKRIYEYNYLTGDTVDITFKTDDLINSTVASTTMPKWYHFTDLDLDRKTGVLYLSTARGVYYLDREAKTWKKFSKNLPMLGPKLGIIHCTGVLYVSTMKRGIWKADLLRNETTPTLSWEINESQTWNDRTNLFCNLVIKQGATLIVKGSIYAYNDVKIIVEPGAKLIVDGGTLSTECGEFWKGIEVWGNANMPQNEGQQGVVELKNSATVENAKYGVRLWKENDWTKTGGILRANNSHFKNVWKGVEYWPYNSYQGQNIELLNKGIIQDCQFTWDDNFYQSQAEAGITMNHVNGVKIYRCSFIDNRTNVSNNEDRPDGITTADAGYRLLGKTVVNQPTIMPDMYFNENLQYCLFKNLNFGIRTYNFASNFTPFIDNCLFENCLHGIELSSVDNAIIVRNKFEYNITNPSSIASMQQIRLNESARFKVEGNTFNNLQKSKTYGTIAINTGNLDNQIYRNKYHGLYVSNYAYGTNANSMFNNHYFMGLRGLEYLCNEYSGSQIYDQYVFTEPSPFTGQGIKLIQGNQYLASGNQFSTINNNHELSNFRSTDNEDLRYYHGSVNIEYPQNISSNIIPIQAEENNICESTLASLPNKKSSIVVKLDELNPSIINKKNALNDLLNLHDREELHVLVNQLSHNNKMQVKTILLENSPYLSVEMIKKIAVKTPGIFPNAWLKELIESNIELLNNLELRSFLTNKTNPFPQGMLKQLVTDSKIKITQRGKKELEINHLEKERNRLINELISIEQEDSVQINWEEVENLNIQLNNPTFYSQNIDIKGSKGNKEEVLEAINAFELYENNFENTQMHEEMLDIKNFKQFYYNKSNPNNGVISLNDTDIQALIQMKEQMKGKAKIQASNMLCFFANICDDFEPVFGTNQKNIEFYQEDNTKLENIQNEVSLYPNPNKGSFVLQCNEKIDTQKLKITSIDGKLIPFNLDEKENNLHYISLTDFKEGVYLIEVHFFSNQKRVIKKLFIY
jgi:hypothetical protein